MRKIVPALFAAALLFSTIPVYAQNSCPCVPLTHLWIVKTCADWTCASTEITLANGDPQLIALPVGINDGRWLIVQRFTAGAATELAHDPFKLEQFDAMDGAMACLSKLTPDYRPIIMTAPDGQMLVISLREPEGRRRTVGH